MLTKIFIGTLSRDVSLSFLEPPLCRIPFQEKEYIGIYLNTSPLSFKELKETVELLKKQFSLPGPFIVFPQNFVA